MRSAARDASPASLRGFACQKPGLRRAGFDPVFSVVIRPYKRRSVTPQSSRMALFKPCNAEGTRLSICVDRAGLRRHNTRHGKPGHSLGQEISERLTLRRSDGGVPEWLKGTDCKSVDSVYVGSNPTPSTISTERCACGCSSMVEQQPSKLNTRVRFPSPAPST